MNEKMENLGGFNEQRNEALERAMGVIDNAMSRDELEKRLKNLSEQK